MRVLQLKYVFCFRCFLDISNGILSSKEWNKIHFSFGICWWCSPKTFFNLNKMCHFHLSIDKIICLWYLVLHVPNRNKRQIVGRHRIIQKGENVTNIVGCFGMSTEIFFFFFSCLHFLIGFHLDGCSGFDRWTDIKIYLELCMRKNMKKK